MLDREQNLSCDVMVRVSEIESDSKSGIIPERVAAKGVFSENEDGLGAEERNSLVSIYFKQIQQYPLLTLEEEQDLGKTIAEIQNEILKSFRMTRLTMLSGLRKTVSDFLSSQKKGKEFPRSRQQLCFEVICILNTLIANNIDRMDARTAKAVISLFQKIERIYSKKEYQDAREKLINSNLRLVVRIALSHMKKGRELLDLVQDGNIGLMKAAEKFEYEKGFKFSTYASRWIVQAMAAGIARKNRQIHLPLHVLEDIAKVMSATSDLEKDLGYSPDYEQISLRTGLPLFDIERAFECLKVSFLSIDAPPNINIQEDLSEIIADDNPLPIDRLEEFQRTEKIHEVLLALPNQRNAEILKLRFQEFTLEEIGGLFERTKERIRQIQERTLNFLRRPRYRRLLENL